MITARFPEGERVRAIILDGPDHLGLSENGASGTAECIYCAYKTMLMSTEIEDLLKELTDFAQGHDCSHPHPAKQSLLGAIAETKGIQIKKQEPKRKSLMLSIVPRY